MHCIAPASEGVLALSHPASFPATSAPAMTVRPMKPAAMCDRLPSAFSAFSAPGAFFPTCASDPNFVRFGRVARKMSVAVHSSPAYLVH